MKRLAVIGGIVVAAIILVLIIGPFFIVNEGEQALVVRFGQIVGTYKTAGLKFRSPFIDGVVKYPKQVMPWDGEPQRIQTKENQFIWVDTTARWRISDPVKFYESIGTLESAYGKLGDVLDSAVRTVIAENYLREAVRDSNRILSNDVKETFQTGDAAGSEALASLTQSQITYEKIDKGRSVLFAAMLTAVKPIVPQYGIEVIDVIPRQIKYSDELTESVFNRMIKERNQIAQAFRSYGEGQKATILGKLENDKRRILSEAYTTAETTKGKADATAAKIYADSYGRDASFFDYWRAIESYRQTLPNFTKTLSTDMDYFKYLYGTRGR
jgi:modulator of FtsH protease HflC